MASLLAYAAQREKAPPFPKYMGLGGDLTHGVQGPTFWDWFTLSLSYF
jgi:hypothetical protein